MGIEVSLSMFNKIMLILYSSIQLWNVFFIKFFFYYYQGRKKSLQNGRNQEENAGDEDGEG